MVGMRSTGPTAHCLSWRARVAASLKRCERVVVAAAAAVVLSGCDPGLGTRGGLVVNRTDEDLVIEVVGASDPHRAEVSAQSSGSWTAYEGCLGTGVAVFAPDGERLTTLDRRICDGERIVIEPDDLPASGQSSSGL